MSFKEAHEMILAEMTEICQLPYRNPLLVMLLDKLQHHLQLICDLRVFLITPLIWRLAVQQKK